MSGIPEHEHDDISRARGTVLVHLCPLSESVLEADEGEPTADQFRPLFQKFIASGRPRPATPGPQFRLGELGRVVVPWAMDRRSFDKF